MASFQFHLLLLHVYFSYVASSGVMDYAAIMDAESEAESIEGAQSHSHTMCVSYQPKFSGIPATAEDTPPSRFVDLSHKSGCLPSDFDDLPHDLSGSTVAVSRGLCDDTQKALTAQGKNISFILIINNNNNSNVLPIPWRKSNAKDKFNIVVAGITWNDYQQVMTLPHPVEVKIYTIQLSHFNLSTIITLFGSTLIILIGALWSVYSEKEKKKPSFERLDPSPSETKTRWWITCIAISLFVIFLIGVLLLMYYLYNYAVYIFIVGFCIAGSHGLQYCLWPIWSRIFSCQLEIPHRCLPCTSEKLSVSRFLLYALCLVVGIFWAVQRHSSYVWILQDILGAALCIRIFKSELPSLKSITIIMALLLIYDVFFVFITPLFTDGGRSIMADAATGGKRDTTEIKNTTGIVIGGGGRNLEVIPNIFIIPSLTDEPFFMCFGRTPHILGFGDVIVPGILIVCNAVFDVRVKSKMAYFISSLIGYFVGMSGCLVAMGYMESAQPALLYLVPATLFPTFVVALIRREFCAIWTKQLVVTNTTDCETEYENAETDAGEQESRFDDSADVTTGSLELIAKL